MVTKEDVERFLNRFHQKVRVFGITFRDDRGKNAEALAKLDITPNHLAEMKLKYLFK